ncbi:MAG: glycosyltransferase family 2 protein [Ruminococcus sp.]|uniref:glycosyltransferase family 2 protein n=1 Tax=Ruminococcus sp. TaxID=41978 RepID=UPI0028739F37|nr:glycosyltransferase family 2 protein [Ruminococcus sp.]MBQ3285585.1 glycosyltransferase family 2 protein [Ruminococcus sp.]
MAFFSVLIPVYNQVGKMQECIDSLNAQSFTDLEIIMVDDGSTDDSYQMLLSFAGKDPRIKVFRHEKNSSLVGARYTGMQHASGEYVFFLDSDDSITADAFEILHKKLIESRPDILRFGYRSEPSGEVTLPPAADDMLELMFRGGVAPAVWKNVYKRELTDKLVANTQPFYCNMSEDVYFSTVFFTFAEKVEAIDDVLYIYQSGTGMSSASNSSTLTLEKFRRSLRDTVKAGEEIMAFLQRFAPERMQAAQEAVDRMNKFVFLQHSAFEKDYRKIVEYAYEYKLQGFDDLYDSICNESLKRKVLFDEGYYKP